MYVLYTVCGVSFQMLKIFITMCRNGTWGPVFIFTTVIFILPILKQKEKEVTTESYSHGFYFYNMTVIKDNRSCNCLTGNGPTLCLGEQTF